MNTLAPDVLEAAATTGQHLDTQRRGTALGRHDLGDAGGGAISQAERRQSLGFHPSNVGD
jgi:hypothetical protein